MDNMLNDKVALITGGAKRIGAAIVHQLHTLGMNLVLHYRHTEAEAQVLQQQLCNKRHNSVLLLQADLMHTPKLIRMIQQIIDHYGRLDVLINNASTFYPTAVSQTEETHWEDLIGINLKAPFFLSQAAMPYLQATEGCIVNLVDIHAERPLKGHAVYCTAKAGLVMLTKALARELSPQVRVNAIAPGAILWPENNMDDLAKQRITSNIPLKRHGTPEDIARTVIFLIRDAHYMTGQVVTIDGGRTLNQ
jgi:pteridine reductase